MFNLLIGLLRSYAHIKKFNPLQSTMVKIINFIQTIIRHTKILPFQFKSVDLRIQKKNIPKMEVSYRKRTRKEETSSKSAWRLPKNVNAM